MPPRKLSQKTLLILVYVASFFYSFHYALPLYIESSFISQFLSAEKMVGIVFAVAAIFTIILTFLFPRFLRRFGNYKITLAVMGLESVTLLFLAIMGSPFIVIPLFILHQILVSVIFLSLDGFIESFSENNKTGGIRGIFMTVLNIAIASAPLVAGLMLTNHDFWKVYLAAAVFMLFGIFVIAQNFRDYADPKYLVPKFKDTIGIVTKSHNLHAIIITHFLLSFFFTWMVIYTPLYLNKHIGVAMNDILGIIIPVALLPFIFFEVILGKIADEKLGEKEILIAGFILMALSTAALSWVTTSSITVWAGILFLTRTGASAVEVTTESYFYKQVTPGDIHLVTFMRMVRASAYVVGPFLGSLVLSFIDYRYLFLTLGIIMLIGIPYGLHFKDTK
ncbi:MAG: MFS transporter [Candidatus Yonathbacteria bacterium]|nr:MFS transporter [Candidatus Yonathbacteria bacterium]